MSRTTHHEFEVGAGDTIAARSSSAGREIRLDITGPDCLEIAWIDAGKAREIADAINTALRPRVVNGDAS